MPAPTTVSTEEILDAGDMLSSAGQPVTGWTLRRVIGRGGPSRLAAVWNEARGTAADPIGGLPVAGSPSGLPPALAEQAAAMHDQLAADLVALAGAVWTEAEAEVSRRVAQEVGGTLARIAAIEAEQAEAERVLAEADERVRSRDHEIEEMRHLLAEAIKERDAADSRAEAFHGIAVETRRLVDGVLAPLVAAARPGIASPAKTDKDDQQEAPQAGGQ